MKSSNKTEGIFIDLSLLKDVSSLKLLREAINNSEFTDNCIVKLDETGEKLKITKIPAKINTSDLAFSQFMKQKRDSGFTYLPVSALKRFLESKNI